LMPNALFTGVKLRTPFVTSWSDSVSHKRWAEFYIK